MFLERLVGRVALASAVTAALLLALSAYAVAPTLGVVFSRQDPVAYKIGDRIDVPASLYEPTPFSVFLFARASCEVCQESRAFYADVLLDIRATPSIGVFMVSAAPEVESDLVFARALGLTRAQFRAIDFGSLRVRRVPTLVVVDRRGTIRGWWEGVPAEPDRSRFKAVVRSTLPQ